jgi:hypothetical protein
MPLSNGGPHPQLVLTTKDQASAAKDALPVSYERLPSMVEVGDEIFLGRYLVTGAEEASLFLEVIPFLSVRPCRLARSDVVCPQQLAALLQLGAAWQLDSEMSMAVPKALPLQLHWQQARQ